MNRKERRAALKQGQGKPHDAKALLDLGNRSRAQGRLDEAARYYRQAIAAKPAYGEAYNSLGCVLLAQGNAKAASAQFLRALVLTPELLDAYQDICAILRELNPALREGMARAANAWPTRASCEQLLGSSGIAAISGDALLRYLLQSATVRDINLERLLTAVRGTVLELAAGPSAAGADGGLEFCCALARQCFINEYVFATTLEELEQAGRLRQSMLEALAGDLPIPPLRVAAVASYFALGSLPHAQSLLDRTWPAPLRDLLAQQIGEPHEERQYRDSIARLTPIDDEVSQSVRQQYEENPYPRWVIGPAGREAVSVNEYFRNEFPSAPFRSLGDSDGVDILVAGCGTGWHCAALAQRFEGARLLAVDLSLASLSYAKRKTRAAGLANIEYAQADILRLGAIGRSFDVIDASGVLHHMADPMGGWSVLLTLLRPGGFMHLGLYSELARRDITAARRFIAERGYRPVADDIRRCRHELLDTPLRNLAAYCDFFSTSECRDLLFHVQERPVTIAKIDSFIREHDLTFVGFEVGAPIRQQYRQRFAEDGGMRDLQRWNVFERERPDTFAGMYQFWVQRN